MTVSEQRVHLHVRQQTAEKYILLEVFENAIGGSFDIIHDRKESSRLAQNLDDAVESKKRNEKQSERHLSWCE